MRLQKNTLLALYSVLEFAAQPGRQLSVAGIAASLRASPHHLAKVLRSLGRAGLVDSVRGARGGYRFAGNPKRITLMDVIELFEDISASSEANTDAGAASDVGGALGMVLDEIDDIAKATFRSISIETMLKLVERRRGARAKT